MNSRRAIPKPLIALGKTCPNRIFRQELYWGHRPQQQHRQFWLDKVTKQMGAVISEDIKRRKNDLSDLCASHLSFSSRAYIESSIRKPTSHIMSIRQQLQEKYSCKQPVLQAHFGPKNSPNRHLPDKSTHVRAGPVHLAENMTVVGQNGLEYQLNTIRKILAFRTKLSARFFIQNQLWNSISPSKEPSS